LQRRQKHQNSVRKCRNMARAKKTTAQRLTQRQRAKKEQAKPIPTHERLGVSRGGKYGDDYTANLLVHSWSTYLYRMGRVVAQAGSLEEVEYRRDQIHYGRNLAVTAKEQAERKEREKPGSANLRALQIDLERVEWRKDQALKAASRREKELTTKPKKKKAKRKKAVKKTAKKPKKKAKKRKKKAVKKKSTKKKKKKKGR